MVNKKVLENFASEVRGEDGMEKVEVKDDRVILVHDHRDYYPKEQKEKYNLDTVDSSIPPEIGDYGREYRETHLSKFRWVS